MSLAIALITNMQQAYAVREAAKNAYHKNRNGFTASAYSEALLDWDLAWSELMNFRIDA